MRMLCFFGPAGNSVLRVRSFRSFCRSCERGVRFSDSDRRLSDAHIRRADSKVRLPNSDGRLSNGGIWLADADCGLANRNVGFARPVCLTHQIGRFLTWCRPVPGACMPHSHRMVSCPEALTNHVGRSIDSRHLLGNEHRLLEGLLRFLNITCHCLGGRRKTGTPLAIFIGLPLIVVPEDAGLAGDDLGGSCRAANNRSQQPKQPEATATRFKYPTPFHINQGVLLPGSNIVWNSLHGRTLT